MIKERETQILGRILELDGERLSPEKAQLVLSLGFSQADHDRVGELAEKANQGTLTPEEREEYAAYVRVGDLLGILQARARLLLKKLGKTA